MSMVMVRRCWAETGVVVSQIFFFTFLTVRLIGCHQVMTYHCPSSALGTGFLNCHELTGLFQLGSTD